MNIDQVIDAAADVAAAGVQGALDYGAEAVQRYAVDATVDAVVSRMPTFRGTLNAVDSFYVNYLSPFASSGMRARVAQRDRSRGVIFQTRATRPQDSARMAKRNRTSSRAAKRRSSSKRRTKSSRKKRTKRAKSSASCSKLSKRVSRVESLIRDSVSNLHWRKRSFTTINTSAGTESVTHLDFSGKDELEAILADSRYYDKSSDTYNTWDAVANTTALTHVIKSAYSKLTFHNPYLMPVNVELWLCDLKKDTNLTPESAWAGQLDNTDKTSVGFLQWPTDSSLFNDLWKIKMKKEFRLLPGQKVSFRASVANCRYNNSVADTHADQYQQPYKSESWLLRVMGDMHQGTSAAEYGPANAKVMIELYNVYHMQYNGGADFDYTKISDTQVLAGMAGGTPGVPYLCGAPVKQSTV